MIPSPSRHLLPCLFMAVSLAILLFTPANSQSPPESTPVYQENFEDGRADGWSLERGWIVRAGKFAGTDGAQTEYTEKSWGEGQLQFSLSTNDARVRFGTLRGNPYTVRFLRGGQGHTVQLFEGWGDRVGPDPIAYGTIASNEGVPLQIEIDVRSGSIAVFVNGRPVIEQDAPAGARLGAIGFETSRGTFATVDDLILRSTAPPLTRATLGTFRGHVYAGEVGDTTRPLGGVAVSLFGSNDSYPVEGTLLRSVVTDDAGRFELPVSTDDGAFEFFSLREYDLEGFASVTARSLAGTSRDENWIEYAAPLRGKILENNIFWDRQLAPDLVVSVPGCELADGGKSLLLTVHVWNKGSAPSPGLLVRAEAGRWSREAEIPALAIDASEEIAIKLPIADEQRGRSYTFRVEVDPEERILDLYRGNNVAESPSCAIPELADLVVRDPHAEILDDARRIRIVATVANVGGTPTPATSVRFSSDDWREEVDLRGLGAEESSQVVLVLSIPNDRRGRDHAFEVLADPDSRLLEKTYRNNLAATEPIAIPHLADLTVAGVRCMILTDGRTVSVRARIKNEGGAPARKILVRADARGWTAERTQDLLPAGEETEVELRLPIEGNHRGHSHTFRVRVDPSGTIIELNEENNEASSTPLEIPNLPDLVLRSPQAEILGGADSLHILVVVANSGAVRAPATTVRGSSGNWELPEIEVPALGPGATTPIEFFEEIPVEQRGWEHKFELSVDPENEIEELDESNNRGTVEGIYIDDLPDLVLEIPQEPTVLRKTVRLEIVLRNIGGAPASGGCLVRATAPGWVARDTTVSGLYAGTSIAFPLELTIEKEHRGRSHRFRVVADVDQIINELDESNNAGETAEVLVENRLSIGLILGVALGILLIGSAILLTIRSRGRVGRRRRWQVEARPEDLPPSCEGGAQVCQKTEIDLELPDRRIAYLTASAGDGQTAGRRRSLTARGEGVDLLNEVIEGHRRGEPVEDLRARISPVARALLQEIAGWLREDPSLNEVKIVAHLESAEITCEFVLYRCVSGDDRNQWEEEDRWKAKIDDQKEEPIGLLVNLDPTDADLTERLTPGLTDSFLEFVRRF